jgi:hypothetical protein
MALVLVKANIANAKIHFSFYSVAKCEQNRISPPQNLQRYKKNDGIAKSEKTAKNKKKNIFLFLLGGIYYIKYI